MITTGVFSGSFNPVHIGHLALANWLCEFEDIDEMWFLVTPRNPFKNETDLIDARRRLEMVRAAIQCYPKFHASDFEFSLPSPYYTINTLRALRDKYPDRKFVFIAGADSWNGIPHWKDGRALMSEFAILVYPRPGFAISIPPEYKNIKKVDAPIINVSSTFIRQAVAEGRDVRFFLPEAIRKDFFR